EDGIRDFHVTGVQTCALPIFRGNDLTALRKVVQEALLPDGPVLAMGRLPSVTGLDRSNRLLVGWRGYAGRTRQGRIQVAEDALRSGERRVGRGAVAGGTHTAE